MRNFIFGSGIVGMVAKEILGDWDIVPFRKSRFFSYEIALADNFIIRDPVIDGLIKDLGGSLAPIFYRRGYSHQGQLTPTADQILCSLWLEKIFGTKVPSHATAYWSNRLTQAIYDIRINQIYENLLNKHYPTLKSEADKGQVTEINIGDHYFVRNGIKEEFDNIICTIPLNVTLSLMGIDLKLEYLPQHYVCVETPDLNFEGLNQVFVVDSAIDFYRVTNIAPNRYLFYSTKDMANIGAVLQHIVGRVNVVDGTVISDAIPVGDMVDLTHLESNGIYCIGSLAQHDWCADVGSNLLRLVSFAQRGFKPKQ